MTSLQKECIAEIRNAYISMCGILRRISRKNITDAQGWIEIAKQLRRQRDYFDILRKNGE